MFADILLRATRVTVLATSRQPLAVPGEHTCAIPPLPAPDAVELFAQCAAAAVPGFAVTDDNRAAVIRLRRRLDGVPLAIELATVRLRAIPLEQLADPAGGPLPAAGRREIADTMGLGYALEGTAWLASAQRRSSGSRPTTPTTSRRTRGSRRRRGRAVDAHIEHIYGKLGVSSGVQLAAWLRSACS